MIVFFLVVIGIIVFAFVGIMAIIWSVKSTGAHKTVKQATSAKTYLHNFKITVCRDEPINK